MILTTVVFPISADCFTWISIGFRVRWDCLCQFVITMSDCIAHSQQLSGYLSKNMARKPVVGVFAKTGLKSRRR